MSKLSRYVAVIVAAATLETGSVHAQKNRAALEAEIETTFTTPQGQFSTPGRYYRSRDGKMREDSPIGSIITDTRSGTVTLLNRATREAKVIVVAGKPRPPSPQADTMLEPFEEASIEGRPVTKARKTIGGTTQELWTARELGLVVLSKVDAPDFAMTKVLRNVSLREPDPAVFRIPKDYTVTHESAPTERAGGPVRAPRLPPQAPPARRQ